MATEAGELIIKISADVADIKAQLGQVSGSVQGLGAKTVAVGSLMADAFRKAAEVTVGFVRDSVMAFAEHEQAMTRLNILVGRDGARAMEEFAKQIQNTTEFSDDQVLSLEKQLAQYGIYPGSVKEATKALVNFAAVTGVDLPEAASMMARAMSGQSRELKAYGLDLSMTASRTENLERTIAFLQQRFPEAAQTMRGTLIGSLHALRNEFSDLEKEIGELFLPLTQKIITIANVEIVAVQGLVRWFKDLIHGTKDSAQAHDEHAKKTDALVKKSGELKGATEREISVLRSLKDELISLEQQEAHLTQITQLETEKRISSAKVSWENNASFADQFTVRLADDMAHNTADWVSMTQNMMTSFADSTAKMIVEGGRFSDIVRNLWQMLAEQVISQIIRMIAEWLIWEAMTGGAGGFGGLFAGHAAAGGMIAEPSMIIGMRTGTRMIAGEAGPEEIVPRGAGGNYAYRDAGGASGGGGGQGGGTVVVNISGQFIEGSPSKWQRLVQTQIAPEIRRLAMKDPNSLIDRKRGSLS